MFKHILVPIDLSERNARALRAALALARQSRARVTLLHVIQSVENIPLGELRDFYRELARASTRKLERVAKRFLAGRVAVRTELTIGEPAREIVRLAAKRRADLAVMGSHRVRAGRPATGWGTTSYKVGIFCRCPILLVK
ncbi:MAG: universal stress protein [Candidatus Rokubacteria bacterium]|nr:universal stress protein [Candidatus Rokubacteria bacterium]